MTLEQAVEKYGEYFKVIPVQNIRYWDELGEHIGEVQVTSDCGKFKKNSTISFELYEMQGEFILAYKPVRQYEDIFERLPECDAFNHE
jgi:hypothetical protein